MLFNPSPRCCLLWTSLAAWRAWRSWLSSRHSSSASVHSGPGILYGSTQLSSVSAENPPHTPVMLKEVLHYLDIQQGQVRNHVCCSVKEDSCSCLKNIMVSDHCTANLNLLVLAVIPEDSWEHLMSVFTNHFFIHLPETHYAPRFKTMLNSTRRSTSQLCVPQC